MPLFSWPRERTQILIAYNFFASLLTTTPAFLANKWLGFATASGWSFFWMYDIVIRPNIFPESEMNEEDKAAVHFQEWMNNQADQSQQQMRRIGERLSTIEEDYSKLKQEYKEMRQEKAELERTRQELEDEITRLRKKELTQDG